MEETVLSVQHLNKSFGKHIALHNVSFTCQRGRIVGLIGANGAGKTTIMKAILSLIRSQGQITIAGQATSFDHHPVLSQVGALIEYPGVYPFLSGRDHLRLYATASTNQARRVQGIIDDLHLNAYVDQPVKGYSLGMKQKMGIALALINQPKLVILDEPMNGLDPQATKDLRELIQRKKAQGVTFLISSHVLGELQKLAEDLIVIDHGRVVQETTMSELLAKNRHFVLLTTDQDQRAATILTTAGYRVIKAAPLKVQLRPDDEMGQILGLLTEQGIAVKDLQHQDDDLEQSVLKLITN